MVAISAAALYVHRKSGAAAANSQPASKNQEVPGGVALARTKTPGTTADKDKKGEEKEKAPVPVSVAPIATGSVSSYISSTANLVAESEVKAALLEVHLALLREANRALRAVRRRHRRSRLARRRGTIVAV